MSEPCRRGYKCTCFQCGETDCERYEPEPPEWMHEGGVATITIPKQIDWVTVKKYEITDECIEQIADAVVRKLMEAKR